MKKIVLVLFIFLLTSCGKDSFVNIPSSQCELKNENAGKNKECLVKCCNITKSITGEDACISTNCFND